MSERSGRSTRRRAGRLCLCVVAVFALLGASSSGCSRPPAPVPPASPRETVARLIEARNAGGYEQIRPLIVPEHAADVISTLLAVDNFLLANRELCDLVRSRVGAGLAQLIDQSERAYYLDIFSKHVELLDETQDGQTATVSFMVDKRLPVRRANLRLVDGTWRYDPGPGDYRQLVRAFDRMAYGLRQACEEVRSGRLSPDLLRDNPEKLVDEVRIRLLPGVKMLPRPEGGQG